MNTMTSLASRALETAPGSTEPAALPTAAWDLVSALENAGEYVKNGGGALLVMMGLAALVWGGVLLLKKLMSGQQNQDSWVKIIMLMIIGGAIAVGGFTLIFEIGSGGKDTIEDLGGGTLMLNALLGRF